MKFYCIKYGEEYNQNKMQTIPKIHRVNSTNICRFVFGKHQFNYAIFAFNQRFGKILWRIQLIQTKCGTLRHWVAIWGFLKAAVIITKFYRIFYCSSKIWLSNKNLSGFILCVQLWTTLTHTRCGLQFIFVFNEPLSILNAAAICVIYC